MGLLLLNQNTAPYELIGGETGLRELVDRFYRLMDTLQAARGIRALHASNLKNSRQKLFLFLGGWMGGPDLYAARHGHPMLRRRHLPFSIGTSERGQWMLCMERALGDMAITDSLRHHLLRAFHQVADHMRNQPEPQGQDGLRIFVHPGSEG